MYLYVPRSEQELSVQIALLNDVHVCHIDAPLGAGTNPHHGKILQNFTANGSCTNLHMNKNHFSAGRDTHGKGSSLIHTANTHVSLTYIKDSLQSI